MCHLIGLPNEDHEQHLRWTHIYSQAFYAVIPDDFLRQADQATIEWEAYFRGEIARGRSNPRGGLLADLIAVEQAGDRLSEQELVTFAIQLVSAGSETTISLIGTALNSLMRRPDQLALFRERPEVRVNAVEEFLRMEAPLQVNFPRVALQDSSIAGVPVPKGSVVMIMLGAANRDGARWTSPDELDITRPDAASLSFGKGIHFCIGAALARLEGRIAIARVLERYPELRPAGQAIYRGGPSLRTIASLPADLGRRPVAR
jgi:cytochrome P450